MNLVERVRNILLQPKKEWTVIDAEPATSASLYSGYVVPLAAIPAIAGFIGTSILGFGVLGSTVRVPIGRGITGAVFQYVAALVGVYVLALIIDALAPNFGGTKSQIQALKLAVYSSTASWIAGIFLLLPGLRALSFLGLYSLFLLYLGLPVLMKSPEDRSLGYILVVIVSAIVIYAVIGAVGSRLTGFGMWGY
ncbi:MAG TPA: Yip1 family protein [Gemmatimonadales bacterium]